MSQMDGSRLMDLTTFDNKHALRVNYSNFHETATRKVAAQHAHAADRFAREILGILECDTMRSRRLMRHSLGRAVPPLLWLLVPVATSTRHAQFQRPRQRACPPKRIAGAPCLITCTSYSLMPISTERQRSMPSPQFSCQLAAALSIP
jgi:hypothetical protein